MMAVFFFNASSSAVCSTLSLHDALPISLDQIPEQLKHAFLAAEDDRFYQHPGVDWRGTLRAVWLYARSMGKGRVRSEEHTSELQSRGHLVCRLLLEKTKPIETTC